MLIFLGIVSYSIACYVLVYLFLVRGVVSNPLGINHIVLVFSPIVVPYQVGAMLLSYGKKLLFGGKK